MQFCDVSLLLLMAKRNMLPLLRHKDNISFKLFVQIWCLQMLFSVIVNPPIFSCSTRVVHQLTVFCSVHKGNHSGKNLWPFSTTYNTHKWLCVLVRLRAYVKSFSRYVKLLLDGINVINALLTNRYTHLNNTLQLLIEKCA